MGEEKALVLNLEGILSFIFDNDVEKNGESEISEVYVMDEDTKNMSLSTKQMRELKSNEFTPNQTIRYDMMKMFLERLLNVEDEEITVGNSLIINTMIHEGLLLEVKNEDL